VPDFPLLCLIVSGGHTDLVLVKDHGHYTRIGGTRDDAAGEAFDKAARMLGLGYPGGPAIQKAAAEATAPLLLPRAWLRGTHDFSFSGLKTALLRKVEAGEASVAADAAAGFQESVVDVLVTKTVAAAADYHARQIVLAGGVAANRSLRERLLAASPLPVVVPAPILCTDNAAMIAACGYRRLAQGQADGLDIDVVPGLRLASTA
jgi:N6-L-threonylcarbamoyladenine synthase